MRTAGWGSPKPGPGRPQYGWSAKDARLPCVATVSRHFTRRGQARQTDTAASSSATVWACPASRSTCLAVRATGVSAVAGSPGQPVQGGTGDSNSWPVTGCASAVTATSVTSTSGDRQCDAIEDVVLRGHDSRDAGVLLQSLNDGAPHQSACADHVDAPRVHEPQGSSLGAGHHQ